jgi:putative membrane protein
VGRVIVVDMIVSIVVILVLQLLGMVIFSWMTPFNDLEELKKGNTAVGLAMGGKFLGTAIILGVSAYTNSSIWHMMLWFGAGYVCLVAVYWVFEWATPGLKLPEHLQQGNVAVGLLLCFVFVGMSFAISSLII